MKRGGDREHDGNRDHDHHPGAQAERHEAHHQHDRDGFRDGFEEVVDRMRDRMRHARYQRQLEAGRQLRLQVLRFGVERLAEPDHVAARLHRDADAEHRCLPFERICVTAGSS